MGQDQKQVKLKAKTLSRHEKLMDINNKVRSRPLLYSSEDTTKIAMEKSKLNILKQLSSVNINHIINDKKEFSSFFLEPKNNTKAPKILTSHGTPPYNSNEKQIIKAYPVEQSLRFNPTVYIAAEQTTYSNTELANQNTFLCTCRNCQSRSCPSKKQSTSRERSMSFKDNIMTFNDQETMTPKVQDASCSCTNCPQTNTNSYSNITNTDVAVRDLDDNVPTKYTSQQPNFASSTLRNHDDNNIPRHYNMSNFRNKSRIKINLHQQYEPINEENYLEPEISRDMCCQDDNPITDCNKCCKKSISDCDKCCQNQKQKDRNEFRQKIYDEGIDDDIVCRQPPPPRVRMSNHCQNCCNTTSCNENRGSRYHKNCVANDRHYHGMEIAHQMGCMNKCMGSKHFRRCCFNMLNDDVPITLPKRMVTSERNIDAYIDRNCPGYHINNCFQ